MVKIQDIVDAMDMGGDEYTAYIDRESGEVCLISGYAVRMVDRGDPSDTLPEWQRPEYEWARLLLETDRMVGVPGQFDVNEWEIMEEFAESRPGSREREKLSDAVHGKGRFSRFKRAVHELGIQDLWHAHRDQAFCEIAKEWCETHHIPFTE